MLETVRGAVKRLFKKSRIAPLNAIIIIIIIISNTALKRSYWATLLVKLLLAIEDFWDLCYQNVIKCMCLHAYKPAYVIAHVCCNTRVRV